MRSCRSAGGSICCEFRPHRGDRPARDPPPVAAFKDAVREGDAILIVYPEYNHGVPGVLKNAIDWGVSSAAKLTAEREAAIITRTPTTSMRTCLLTLSWLLLCLCSHPGKEDITHMRRYKQDVTLWYDAFTRREPALLDRILSEDWVDIPAAPGQLAGPEGVKRILAELTTAFPDLKITIQEVLQDGNKVVVRSQIAGTQRGPFMGFPAKNRAMAIQAIDIHEFNDGKLVRTWHTEDWLTGLHQLGVLEK